MIFVILILLNISTILIVLETDRKGRILRRLGIIGLILGLAQTAISMSVRGYQYPYRELAISLMLALPFAVIEEKIEDQFGL